MTLQHPVSIRSRREPGWCEWQRLRRSRVPARFVSWLRDDGSLTLRLKCACGDRPFAVRLLRQGWARALPSEARRLGLRRGGLALVREVQLLCDGEPWVFARTLIPATTLRGPGQRLARLGERPLGAVLFADRRVRRGVTEMAQLRPGEQLFDSATQGLPPLSDTVWGRRTLFFMAGRPLLVNELFLPTIPGGPG